MDANTNCEIEKVQWEVKHLKELVLEMFGARDKAMDAASESMEKRLESMNEFREQLREQTGKFITRIEHDALISSIAVSQDRLSGDIGKAMTGLAGLDAKLYIGGAGVVVLLTVFQLIINFWRHL